MRAQPVKTYRPLSSAATPVTAQALSESPTIQTEPALTSHKPGFDPHQEWVELGMSPSAHRSTNQHAENSLLLQSGPNASMHLDHPFRIACMTVPLGVTRSAYKLRTTSQLAGVKLAFSTAILLVGLVPMYAQNDPSGMWRADTGTANPWELVIRADRPNKIAGAVSSCASVLAAFEIFEGQLEGSTVTFKCTSGDGQRTISLRGTVRGDEINFTWQKKSQEGGNRDTVDGIFNDSSPRQFTAKRVAETPDQVTKAADRAMAAAVSFDRILHAAEEPQNWLTYSGTLSGQRFSPLTQLTPANVNNLELAWLRQVDSAVKFEATPLVVEGIMYTVRPENDVVALDAATGRVRWTYTYTAKNFRVCCGRVNRGLAILSRTLFMGTLDAHLLAIDASTGKLVWDTTVADSADPACKGDTCYSITHAPLVVKDKVIVGTAGGEGNIRGFIAAFDAATGKEAWRFYTIPGPGEPGNETWSGDSWKTGGAGVWNAGTYDSDLNLIYFGTGNPHPTRSPDSRLGDNLYSDSVVALDADSGNLKWYFQFVPHDNFDWDAAHVPVLADISWEGRTRKALILAHKSGVMWVLDRSTGEFLTGKPFVAVNWMNGFDQAGHPQQTLHASVTDSDHTLIMPYVGTQWSPPSFSPRTGFFYVPAWERVSSIGSGSLGAQPGPAYGALRAFDPATGEMKWEFKKNDAEFTSGALTTASGLLFTGTVGDTYSGAEAARLADGYFYALDARTGQLLWQTSLAGGVHGGPMSYSVNGRQYVAVAAGSTLFAFALRQ